MTEREKKTLEKIDKIITKMEAVDKRLRAAEEAAAKRKGPKKSFKDMSLGEVMEDVEEES